MPMRRFLLNVIETIVGTVIAALILHGLGLM
jgi:hypothetical protein